MCHLPGCQCWVPISRHSNTTVPGKTRKHFPHPIKPQMTVDELQQTGPITTALEMSQSPPGAQNHHPTPTHPPAATLAEDRAEHPLFLQLTETSAHFRDIFQILKTNMGVPNIKERSWGSGLLMRRDAPLCIHLLGSIDMNQPCLRMGHAKCRGTEVHFELPN